MELIVDSMQINNVDVNQAKVGDAVGVKVSERVRRGDTVYKVTEWRKYPEIPPTSIH